MAEVSASPWPSLQDPPRSQSNASSNPSNHNAASPTATSSTGLQSDSPQSHQRGKPKQKRNKPTLSCRECVEHKTKCDRGRPTCLACIKRSTSCEYTQIAEILATNGSASSKKKRPAKAAEDDRAPQPSSKLSIANITHPSPGNLFSPGSYQSTPSSLYSHSQTTAVSRGKSADTSRSANASTFRMASLLSVETAPLSVFGMGGEHPFANYWTCKGGLAEVVSVLPSKSQADILIAKYFEIVDPVYPILDRPSFLQEYELFWSLSEEGKCQFEAATVSLHFVIYATATQYIELPSPTERTKTAEFYISAAHQALRISSYLNRMTITTIQTMVLIFYFLIHDNHVSDAWTFSGITHRQAYVLQLNREPDLVVPNASVAEKNMRCKLWSAVIFQETTIALTLKLPSTSLQSDVGPHSLNYDEADKTANFNTSLENGDRPIAALCSELTKTDISYCKAIWAYSAFVQENICRQRALGLPICQSANHKRDLVSSFRSLYRALPMPFGSYDPKRFLDPSRRVARQQIALTQNFFHALMLICADENDQTDVIVDSLGTLEAAHEALGAFFAMNALFGDETNGWWAAQHRAFEQALLVANLLAADKKPLFPQSLTSGMNREYELLVNVKRDVQRMLEIMGQSRGAFEYQSVQEQRYEKLRTVLECVTVV